MKVNRNEYDNVRLDVERLKAGGHKCIIKQVLEGRSQTGKDMLTISYDTTEEDSQPKFFTEDYLGQSGTAKKWHGNHYIVRGNDYFLKNLKQFVGAAEASNEGFVGHVEDGNEYEILTAEFKNKLVGIVFREEEYLANTGRKGTSVKSFYFCNYADAEDKPVPEKRTLPEQTRAFASPDPAAASEGFMAVPDNLEDEGLPFK